MLKFHGKGLIPRLGSKFCGPRKTVGTNNMSRCLRYCAVLIQDIGVIDIGHIREMYSKLATHSYHTPSHNLFAQCDE